jgi:TRAP-type C4-dicarboxylate transport system substrate-binding protein
MDRKWMIGSILLFGLASFFSFPIPARTAPPEVITLKYCEFRPFQGMKFSDHFRASASRSEAAKRTLLAIEKKTEGRIRHQYHCDKSSIKGMDFLSPIKAGKYDLGGGPNVLFQPARFPIWQCSQLMFLGGPAPWASLRAWNELAFTNVQLRAELDRQGMKFLGAFSYPSILISRKPLAEPENLRGMKLRAMGQAAKWAVSLGGTVVPIVDYAVPEALKEGIIDGIVGYPYVLYNYCSQDHCKFLVRTPMANSIIYDNWINLDTWRKIPADLQKIYEETWRETYPQIAIEYARAEVAGLEKAFKDAGVRFLEFTDGQYGKWKASSAFLAEQYMKKMTKMGADGKKIIEKFEKLYKKTTGERNRLMHEGAAEVCPPCK